MNAAKTPQRAVLERVTVRTADGRLFDLGNPNALLFRLRVFIYRIRRYIRG